MEGYGLPSSKSHGCALSRLFLTEQRSAGTTEPSSQLYQPGQKPLLQEVVAGAVPRLAAGISASGCLGKQNRIVVRLHLLMAMDWPSVVTLVTLA